MNIFQNQIQVVIKACKYMQKFTQQTKLRNATSKANQSAVPRLRIRRVSLCAALPEIDLAATDR